MQCFVIIFREPYLWLDREGNHLRINTRKFSRDIARYRLYLVVVIPLWETLPR